MDKIALDIGHMFLTIFFIGIGLAVPLALTGMYARVKEYPSDGELAAVFISSLMAWCLALSMLADYYRI